MIFKTGIRLAQMNRARILCHGSNVHSRYVYGHYFLQISISKLNFVPGR